MTEPSLPQAPVRIVAARAAELDCPLPLAFRDEQQINATETIQTSFITLTLSTAGPLRV
ncbi:MAG TPA: hypothetical protein VMM79_11330 [Longimicrobiales bacterium]|nr:hypothetical protein [Longimicrobiales bacterium]